MAEETKNQSQATATARAAADEGVTERQATDSNGRLKAGYSYRYVPDRDENGRRVSRKVYEKVGG